MLFVARQPIFDTRLQVCAYEILFRSSLENSFPPTEENSATVKVIAALVGSADGDQLTGGKRAFINFPRELLLDGTVTVLPPEKTVIEVLENVEPDDEVVGACSRLRARGYQLALDDFVPSPEPHRLIPVADILKVDFRLASPAQQLSAAERFGARLQLLAEKVESQEEFRRAEQMGYRYYQGYFFARPQVRTARQFAGLKLNCLRILQELHRRELDFSRVTALLRREQAISYKLLRFVNSALFLRHEPIDSIHRALTFVGEEAARKWLTVVALVDAVEDHPPELAVNTLVRARFSELLAPAAGLAAQQDACFLMGLFSRLDTMLGRPLEELLQELNLQDEIVRALLDRPLPPDRLPALWKIVQAYETADWERVIPLSANLKIQPENLTSCYTEALAWADTVCAQ